MNTLYPIFLKTNQLHFLVVGGGFVALEKLEFLFKSSPDAKVTLVSPMVREETQAFIADKDVQVIKQKFRPRFLRNKHIVIATTDNPKVNERVYKLCRKRNLLVNVADNPPLCDFYMGGIVTKGNLKIAISTNGKSPTLAKRLRQWLEGFLPEETDALLDKLYVYRNRLKGDFEQKIAAMNTLTAKLLEQHD
ncbi:MAG: precorrin-2 dehydrogenase/sirohydrochlorin ferrochelatase family protein [Flavobacteriaceae bacterium]